MAGDQEIALDVKTPSLPAAQQFDPASQLQNAQTIQENQIKLPVLARQSQLQDVAYQNQMIANAAAHGFDSDTWDAAFKDAASRGVPGAAQFVGRYNPILQQRVLESFGAPSATGAASAGGAAGGQTSPDMLDRMYANVTPQQMAQSLQRNQAIAAILPTISDQTSLTAAIGRLTAMGIPNAAQILGGPQFSRLVTPNNIFQAFNATQGRIAYLQNRVSGAATGQPAPLIKNEIANVGDVAYSENPYTGTATAITPPKPEKIGTDVLGNDVYGVRDASAPGGFRRIDVNAAGGSTQPVTIAEAAGRIQPTENTTGNPAAANPRSSAVGNDQFTDATWLDTVKAAHPELAKSMDDKQLLALRTVPAFDSAMTVELAKTNAAALTKAGVPVTTATVALAHRFGAEGATKIFDAPPSTPMEKIISADALKANPELKGQTSGDYIQGLVKQVGNNPVTAGGAASSAQPGAGTAEPGAIGPLPGPAEAIAQAMAHYDYPAQMSGYALARKGGQALVGRAMEIAKEEGRTFDFTDYANKSKAVQSFGSGPLGNQVRFFNNTVQHLGTLGDLVTALGNGDVKAINAAANAVKNQFGVPVPGNFEAAKAIVGQEVVKAIVANGGGEAERQAAAATLSAAKSPQQLQGIINTYLGLAGAQLRDLKLQYEQNTGLKNFDDKLIPESKAELAKVMTRANATTAGGTAPVIPPVPGAKLYQGTWYTRGPNGEAVPVKQ